MTTNKYKTDIVANILDKPGWKGTLALILEVSKDIILQLFGITSWKLSHQLVSPLHGNCYPDRKGTMLRCATGTTYIQTSNLPHSDDQHQKRLPFVSDPPVRSDIENYRDKLGALNRSHSYVS